MKGNGHSDESLSGGRSYLSDPQSAEAAASQRPQSSHATVYQATEVRVRQKTRDEDDRGTHMDDMAREWVNARLEATEERMNARLAGIEGSIAVLGNKMDALGVQVLDSKGEA